MDNNLQRLTADIVAAYAANNGVAPHDLPSVIQDIYSALNRLGKEPNGSAPAEPQKPAAPIKRSVTPDHLVCLECGHTGSMLKRHLRTVHGMTPDEYHIKWRLPPEYPMTAPNYAEARSQFAKSMGLGRRSVWKKSKGRK